MADNSTTRLVIEWTSAGIGCACADGFMNPLEIIKVRMQAQTGKQNKVLSFANVLRVGQDVVSKDGFSSIIIPGLLPTALRGFFYAGFRIGMYPTVNTYYQSLYSSSSSDFIVKLCAGATTGAVGSFIFNPIDVVRVRFQKNRLAYPNTFSAFSTIVKEEGVKGLWTGASVSVMRSSLMSGSQLATYDTWKKMMIKLTGITDTPILHVIGSVISGVVAQTVIMPVDTIKTRVMIARSTNVANTMGMTAGGTVTPGATVPITQVSPNSTPLGALRQLLKEGGVGALYKGYVPGVMRQIPTMFIQMPLIEQIRKVMGLGYL